MQQKITLKYILMRNYHETNSSINQILEMLKNYRNEGKHRQSSDFSFDSKMPMHHPSELNFTSFNLSNRYEQTSLLKQKLNASHERLSTKQSISPSLFGQTKKMGHSSIFQRLYQENKELKKKREKLFQEGKKRRIDIETNDCTFSPNLRTVSKSKESKGCTETDAEVFYKKGIDWQTRLKKANQIKKYQKNNETIKEYTFSPQTNLNRSRSMSKNEKQNTCLKNKGVVRHLNRQNKARQAEQLLKARWATVQTNDSHAKPFVF